MSDIVIRGMEMPKTEKDSFLVIVKPNEVIYHYDEDEFKRYKAVELPPHGRLIDADAFKQLSKDKFIKCAVEIADGTIIACKAFPMKQFFDLTDRTPTVLEANHEH